MSVYRQRISLVSLGLVLLLGLGLSAFSSVRSGPKLRAGAAPVQGAGPRPAAFQCYNAYTQSCVCPTYEETYCNTSPWGQFASCETIEGESCDPTEPGIRCSDTKVFSNCEY